MSIVESVKGELETIRASLDAKSAEREKKLEEIISGFANLNVKILALKAETGTKAEMEYLKHLEAVLGGLK